MSDPIVIELQRLAADNRQDISDLLRKALIVSTKLRNDDFKAWVNSELNGYEKRDAVPEYRRIPTQLKSVNRWRGWLDPILIPDKEIADLICYVPMMQPIAELQGLITSTGGMFHLSLLPGELDILWRMFDVQEPLEIIRGGSRLSIVRVVDSVRNMILEWSLRLEEQGILGHGMTFTAEEKTKAMTSQNIHIGSFQGILGDVAGSTVTQKQEMTINQGDFSSLKRTLTDAGIDETDIQTLKTSLDADPRPESPAKLGPKVSTWSAL